MDIVWDQTGFEKLLESLPAERLEEDKQTLTAIFNKAAKSPTLKAELDWAQEHGVKFFVDHTCQTAEGYYQSGTGVVAIAKNARFTTDVEILAHEIRHAWQDHHGLLQMATAGQDFLSYYSHLSIVEADATAFQRTAQYEYAGGTDEWAWDSFAHWYSTLAVTYGSAAARQCAQKMGIVDASPPPDYRLEFNGASSPIRHQPDISVQEVFPLLNQDFSGKEYFNAAAAPDFLKKITDHAAAAKFYQDYGEPSELVQAICAKQGVSL